MKKADGFLEPVTSEEDDNEMSLRPYEINTYPADFTLEVLVSKWVKDEVKSPPLQRRFVWNQIRASKLIESFLMGLPVPPVYLYQDRISGTLLIVDGQQRLRSIAYFFSGLFGDVKTEDPAKLPIFNLTGLHEKSPFLGATFQSLEKASDSSAINRLKNGVLRAFVMKQLEPDDDTSIFQVFERLNTGGMILQGQEIRNCIYEGGFNELLKKTLNTSEDWRDIVGTQTEDKRMRDVELILRFFALFYNVSHYEKPMKGFLNTFMRKHRHPHLLANKNDSVATKRAITKKQKDFKKQEEEFESLFNQTANLVLEYLGSKPFHIKRGLNAAVFDSVFTAFAHYFYGKNKKSSAAHIKKVRANFKTLLKDKEYLGYVSAATTDQDIVPKRLKKAAQILFK